MIDLSRASLKYIAEVDSEELACRMLEAMQRMKRPLGATATESLAGLDAESEAWIRRGAAAAILYMSECFAAANRVA